MKEDIHKSLEPLRQLKMPLGIIVPISTIALNVKAPVHSTLIPKLDSNSQNKASIKLVEFDAEG